MLQALREYQSDTFDDWRDLLEEQERRTRDELDASKVLPKLLTLLSSNTGLMLSLILSLMLRSCSAVSYCAACGLEGLAYILQKAKFTTEQAPTRIVTSCCTLREPPPPPPGPPSLWFKRPPHKQAVSGSSPGFTELGL